MEFFILAGVMSNPVVVSGFGKFHKKGVWVCAPRQLAMCRDPSTQPLLKLLIRQFSS